jgi:Spy/CpxP family protein refolding chaperone
MQSKIRPTRRAFVGTVAAAMASPFAAVAQQQAATGALIHPANGEGKRRQISIPIPM